MGSLMTARRCSNDENLKLALLAPPANLVREELLDYDPERFPFWESVLCILGDMIPKSRNLSDLHKTRLGRQTIARNAVSLPPDRPWQRRFAGCSSESPLLFARFLEVYHDFIGSVILPCLNTRCVAFEALPLFRCHLPGESTQGSAHRDEESGHSASEINFWIPMTPAHGSNSLFAESRRGLGDFHAFEAHRGIGQYVRFHGSQVWHYTVPNETDVSRVSFDFRVIRKEEWSRAAFEHFPLGSHYSVWDSDNGGLLHRSSDALQRLVAADAELRL
eukprot:TRINITY_DN23011_c0_g1_i1.p1 TRINITY_DN23011_c0_g1~~TRINITY_DN23011_c0_g1_i1.p1  ORF type:complete len:276 (+),score=29.02 TRINITY_DN23011_c0_g1_i1:147-974(+)